MDLDLNADLVTFAKSSGFRLDLYICNVSDLNLNIAGFARHCRGGGGI